MSTCHVRALFTLLKEDKEKFFFRTDLVKQKDKVVCAHHKALILDRYEVLQNYCCNRFKIHKKNIGQSLQVICLKFAKELKEKEFLVIPGHKICRNCKSQLNKLCEKASGMIYDTALRGDSTDSEETCATSLSNSQLKYIWNWSVPNKISQHAFM